jgi:hypothetical protein
LYVYVKKNCRLTLEEANLEIFTVFMNFCLFILPFLSEPSFGDSVLTLETLQMEAVGEEADFGY